MKYSTVIFDMDGTILDTLLDMKESINWALKEAGFPLRSLEEVRRFVGNGNHLLAERAVPEGAPPEKVEEVFQNFHKHYRLHCMDHTHPYEGIIRLIGALRREGIHTAVVSNKADYAVQELAARFFPGLFDEAVGEKEGIRRKPWPDSVFSVMDALGAGKESTVYVGDSEVDIETAGNAGIPCISVDWGFRTKPFLIAHGASVIAETMDQLSFLLTGGAAEGKKQHG